MRVVDFIINIAILYFLIYLCLIATTLIAVIIGYFTPDECIKILALTGSFLGVFFGVIYNFFVKHKQSDLSRSTSVFNSWFCIFAFLTVLTFGSGLELGILMDLLNVGFTLPYHFDIYFLMVQGTLGMYTGGLITEIFEKIDL